MQVNIRSIKGSCKEIAFWGYRIAILELYEKIEDLEPNFPRCGVKKEFVLETIRKNCSFGTTFWEKNEAFDMIG